jgi:hypothetical protein
MRPRLNSKQSLLSRDDGPLVNIPVAAAVVIVRLIERARMLGVLRQVKLIA